MSNIDSITEEPDFFDLIENAPENLAGVARLASWSTNYDARTGTPFGVFLDLIGYSEEQFGENLVKNPQKILGYLELDYLANALRNYADNPAEVNEFVEKLITAEK
jgi:hypothetical protein